VTTGHLTAPHCFPTRRSSDLITPIRDLKLTRQEEVAYLQENGEEYSWEKAQYSINKGIWGTSIGGKETLTSSQPLPEEAYPSPRSEEHTSELQSRDNRVCRLL